MTGAGTGDKHSCDCHDRLNGVLGHYLGIALLFSVGATLYLGVSGKAKDTALLPTLQTFNSLITLVVGGMLAVWQPKPKEAAGTKDDPTHSEIVNKSDNAVPMKEVKS